MSNTHSNSSFWYDFDQDDTVDILTGEDIKPGKDYVKMAATLRAISNFVRIVTGENIPVKYSNKDESFTDGKQVVISGNIKDKDFDPTVGLALHEGSHCKLTNFDLLKQDNFDEYIKLNFNITEIAEKYGYYETMWDDEKDQYVNTHTINTRHAINKVASTLKQILNYVEDRRIDNFIYKSAPGYQGYYKALYDKYFHASVIDKALRSEEKTSLDLDSYMFRLINLTNVNRNLDALPDLRKIWSILDLKNIDRLKNTGQALDVAAEIYKVIDSNIPEIKNVEEQKDGGDNQKNSGEGSSSQESNGSSSKDLSQEDIDNIAKKIVEDEGSTSQGSPSNNGKASKAIELSDSQKRSLDKAIEKQKELLNGEVKKSNLSKKDKNNVQAIADSGSDQKTVGKGLPKNWYDKTGTGTDCLVIKNISANLAESNVYQTFSKQYKWRFENNAEAINKGIVLGSKLGRKLQVRNDERTLKYSRLNKGKLDKRLVASLGHGYQSVFQQVFEERFKPGIVHISVDASGSMSGQKWINSQVATVAIAKAASMVQNLEVVISYRSTEQIGKKMTPAIFIAYDSRKDKITKIQSLFKYINCPGTTPEGLCFEAIQREIVDGSRGVESFFINFSDGEPYFENADITYYGDAASNHTKKQVDNMKSRGIKVLSYFITGGYSSDKGNFTKMYGKDAEFIDTNSLVPLANSLNKMFATA